MAFPVVLDANVLYPIALTDFFLTLGAYGLYRPHWSTEILHEVERNLLADYPGITPERLAYRFAEMNRAQPGALVDPPPELVAVMTNDEKDRHVLATAIVCQASVICTFNTKDFPAEACSPYNVEAQHPDVFAEHLVALDPDPIARAVQEMSDRTQNPHIDPPQIMERLQRDLPMAIDRLIPALRPR